MTKNFPDNPSDISFYLFRIFVFANKGRTRNFRAAPTKWPRIRDVPQSIRPVSESLSGVRNGEKIDEGFEQKISTPDTTPSLKSRRDFPPFRTPFCRRELPAPALSMLFHSLRRPSETKNFENSSPADEIFPTSTLNFVGSFIDRAKFC